MVATTLRSEQERHNLNRDISFAHDENVKCPKRESSQQKSNSIQYAECKNGRHGGKGTARRRSKPMAAISNAMNASRRNLSRRNWGSSSRAVANPDNFIGESRGRHVFTANELAKHMSKYDIDDSCNDETKYPMWHGNGRYERAKQTVKVTNEDGTEKMVELYEEGQRVLYKFPQGRSMEATVLEVNLDKSMEPDYMIRFDNGKIKNTDSNHLMAASDDVKSHKSGGVYFSKTETEYSYGERGIEGARGQHRTASPGGQADPRSYRGSFAKNIRMSIRNYSSHGNVESQRGGGNSLMKSFRKRRKPQRKSGDSLKTHSTSGTEEKEPWVDPILSQANNLPAEPKKKSFFPSAAQLFFKQESSSKSEEKCRRKMYSVSNQGAVRRSVVALTHANF